MQPAALKGAMCTYLLQKVTTMTKTGKNRPLASTIRSILTFALSVFSVMNSNAGKYSYSDNPDNEGAYTMEVCQDFIFNLRILGEPAMVCDRTFTEMLPQFSKPQWVSLDIRKYGHLVEQIQRYNSTRSHYMQDYGNTTGDLHLFMTTGNINGVESTILRYEQGPNVHPCNPADLSTFYSIRQFYIIDNKLLQIDTAGTDASTLDGLDSFARNDYPDLFFYKNRVFLAYWRYNGPGKGQLSIFGDIDNFCQFDFNLMP